MALLGRGLILLLIVVELTSFTIFLLRITMILMHQFSSRLIVGIFIATLLRYDLLQSLFPSCLIYTSQILIASIGILGLCFEVLALVESGFLLDCVPRLV